MKFKPKEIAVPALILCAICLIITGALSVTNFITKDTIEALNLQTEKEARTVVLPEYLVSRQPFPGPGLAIRIIAEVTSEKLEILKNLIM